LSIFRLRGRLTYKALMRRTKPDLVHAYIQMLDDCAPASPDATEARTILQKTESKLLTVTQELGLLRRWYEGTKHLIGSDS
jgi:hypothetical protein